MHHLVKKGLSFFPMAFLFDARKMKFGTYIVQLVIEPAGVADGLAVLVPPPQRRRGRVAVGANRALAAVRRLMNK